MLFCKKYDLFSYRKYKTSKYGVSSFNVATFGSNNYIILTLHWTDHFSGFIIGNVSHSSWRLCVFFFCWSNCFTSSHTNISIVLSSGLCAGQFPKYWTSSSTINYFVARDVWHGALSFWKKKKFPSSEFGWRLDGGKLIMFSCLRFHQLLPIFMYQRFCFKLIPSRVHHQMLPSLWCILYCFFLPLFFLNILLDL